MSDLMTNHAKAMEWSERVIDASRTTGIFGSFRVGVAWTEDGNPFESQSIDFDPRKLVVQINRFGFPLLVEHDPGKPMGKVIAAELFEPSDGTKFVGVVLGLYDGASFPGFSDFAFDFQADPGVPKTLPDLTEKNWLEIGVDPRVVEAAWVNDAAEGAPLRVKMRPLSHNAASATADIIRVTLPYVALVWNPLVTRIATKAGEETYAIMRKWIVRLFRKLAERNNPVMILQASLDDCDVFFAVRGNNISVLMSARDGLEGAASQARNLVQAMRRQNAPLHALFYEFDRDRMIWTPSYGELADGRLITDNRALVLAEKLPTGLSLGLGGPEDD